ncbi:MAG TPA: hypothetical protein VNA28_02360 [Solirubrobacteraceae bacterium]|nr:hypothetical protein [Solirubrobacteraceae bacterium]
MAPKPEYTTLEAAGHEIRISRPSNEHAGYLARLLELARRDEEEGLGDAPWPPNVAKQPGEPKRVQPPRAGKQE